MVSLPKISIIIVHYKTITYTFNCIKDITNLCKLAYEIIVVDNNSNDDAKQKILLEYPEVIWISNQHNEGFGRANNLGAKHAKGEILFFVNSDIKLIEDSFETCTAQLLSTKNIGVLGCKLLNPDLSHQKSVYKHVGTLSGILKNNIIFYKLFYKEPEEIQAVMGAFMAIKRDLFDQLQGFDPDFFMYAEELELCYRVAQTGMKIVYSEETSVIHYGGGSSQSEWSSRQIKISTGLLHLKTGGLRSLLFFHIISIIHYFIQLLVIWKLKKSERKSFLNEIRDYFILFPYFMVLFFKYKQKRGGQRAYFKYQQ